MIYQLNLNVPNASFSVSVTLDKISYILAFDYNYRNESWYVTICTNEFDVIAASVLITAHLPLFYAYNDPRLPQGKLYVEDTTGKSSNPKFNSFGDTHFLAYESVL